MAMTPFPSGKVLLSRREKSWKRARRFISWRNALRKQATAQGKARDDLILQ